MPDLIGGTIQALKALLPVHVDISAIADTTPIQVTTATPHGCETGDTAVIDGVVGFTGGYEVVVTSVTTLLLVGTTADGASGAGGTLRCAGFGSDFQVPSFGDDMTPASVNAAFEALADRTALLMYQTQYEQAMHPGGKFIVFADASIEVRNNGSISLLAGSTIHGDAGSTISGDVGVLGDLRLLSPSLFEIQSGATEAVRAGGFLNIYGVENIESGGKLINLSGGLIDIKGDGDVSPGTHGDMIFRSAAMLEMALGSVHKFAAGAELLMDGATSGSPNINSTWHGVAQTWDNCTQTFTADSNLTGTKIDNCENTFTGVQTQEGPTFFSGNDGYRVIRRTNDFTASDHTISPWQFDLWRLPNAPSGDYTLKFNNAPESGIVVRFFRLGNISNKITFTDSSNTEIGFLDAATQGSTQNWVDFESNGTTWSRVATGGDSF